MKKVGTAVALFTLLVGTSAAPASARVLAGQADRLVHSDVHSQEFSDLVYPLSNDEEAQEDMAMDEAQEDKVLPAKVDAQHATKVKNQRHNVAENGRDIDHHASVTNPHEKRAEEHAVDVITEGSMVIVQAKPVIHVKTVVETPALSTTVVITKHLPPVVVTKTAGPMQATATEQEQKHDVVTVQETSPPPPPPSADDQQSPKVNVQTVFETPTSTQKADPVVVTEHATAQSSGTSTVKQQTPPLASAEQPDDETTVVQDNQVVTEVESGPQDVKTVFATAPNPTTAVVTAEAPNPTAKAKAKRDSNNAVVPVRAPPNDAVVDASHPPPNPTDVGTLIMPPGYQGPLPTSNTGTSRGQSNSGQQEMPPSAQMPYEPVSGEDGDGNGNIGQFQQTEGQDSQGEESFGQRAGGGSGQGQYQDLPQAAPPLLPKIGSRIMTQQVTIGEPGTLPPMTTDQAQGPSGSQPGPPMTTMPFVVPQDMQPSETANGMSFDGLVATSSFRGGDLFQLLSTNSNTPVVSSTPPPPEPAVPAATAGAQASAFAGVSLPNRIQPVDQGPGPVNPNQFEGSGTAVSTRTSTFTTTATLAKTSIDANGRAQVVPVPTTVIVTQFDIFVEHTMTVSGGLAKPQAVEQSATATPTSEAAAAEEEEEEPQTTRLYIPNMPDPTEPSSQPSAPKQTQLLPKQPAAEVPEGGQSEEPSPVQPQQQQQQPASNQPEPDQQVQDGNLQLGTSQRQNTQVQNYPVPLNADEGEGASYQGIIGMPIDDKWGISRYFRPNNK